MTVYLVVLLSVLNSIGQRGSKVAVSLYALELGVGPFTVGLLAAMFAAFPLLLAVHAGRISDRIGVRTPILLGSATMACGLALPALAGGLPALFLCPALIGLGHIFFHVSIHNLVGSLGAAQDRTRNFSTFALGSSIAAFIGPSLAGFGIEISGYRVTFALLAAIALMPALIVLLHKALIPAHVRYEEETAKRALDLLSSAAVAGFIVRALMHRLAKRFTEAGVLTGSLFVSALAYVAVPALTDGALLALAAFALGLALGSAQPLTILLTYNHAPKGRAGEALGMRIMANKVTQIALPLIFGGMGAALGAAPVFLSTGVFLLAGGVLSLRELRNQA